MLLHTKDLPSNMAGEVETVKMKVVRFCTRTRSSCTNLFMYYFITRLTCIRSRIVANVQRPRVTSLYCLEQPKWPSVVEFNSVQLCMC